MVANGNDPLSIRISIQSSNKKNPDEQLGGISESTHDIDVQNQDICRLIQRPLYFSQSIFFIVILFPNFFCFSSCASKGTIIILARFIFHYIHLLLIVFDKQKNLLSIVPEPGLLASSWGKTVVSEDGRWLPSPWGIREFVNLIHAEQWISTNRLFSGGSFGVVYKGIEKKTGELVAIKHVRRH